MEQIVKFVNQLSNDGDVLGVDFLQELLDTARFSMSSHVHNGVLHEFGGLDGVEDRLASEEAAAFLQLAKQGDAKAQCGLGFLQINGQGVPQDDVAAVRWFRLAADQGHAVAQHDLGEMYADGRGGRAQDDVTAYILCLTAAGRSIKKQ
jgi:TPR repeat protein